MTYTIKPVRTTDALRRVIAWRLLDSKGLAVVSSTRYSDVVRALALRK